MTRVFLFVLVSGVIHAGFFFPFSIGSARWKDNAGTTGAIVVEPLSIVRRTGGQSVRRSLTLKSNSGAAVDTRSIFDSGNVRPSYPQIAIESGWEGELRLRVSVDSQGQVAHAEITQSSGYAILDESALLAARTWRLAGYVSEQVDVPIQFALD